MTIQLAEHVRAGGASRVRLDFVVCPAHHGATLLSLLLNNHSLVSALGDTVPTRSYDQVCACGARVSGCAFWQTVVDELNVPAQAPYEMLLPAVPLSFHGMARRWPPVNRRLNGFVRKVIVTLSRGGVPGSDRAAGALFGDFADLYLRFYELVRQLHGTTVVVDGSKEQRKIEAIAAALRDRADIRVIHVVRDPRGFAASMIRKDRPNWSVERVASRWNRMHSQALRLPSLGRYELVRYEDLCAAPEPTMARVLQFLDVPTEDVVGPPRWPEKHHLMGNKMLFEFDGRIAHDERWRTELTPRQQDAVRKRTAALARRFGYE